MKSLLLLFLQFMKKKINCDCFVVENMKLSVRQHFGGPLHLTYLLRLGPRERFVGQGVRLKQLTLMVCSDSAVIAAFELLLLSQFHYWQVLI
jgi:hypothetical protein